MAKRFIDTATDTIWIVVAVNKQSTSVKMLQREPKHLMPNEYSYKLKIVTNFKYWEDRVKEYEMPEVNASLSFTKTAKYKLWKKH